jgi:hypothetical protein
MPLVYTNRLGIGRFLLGMYEHVAMKKVGHFANQRDRTYVYGYEYEHLRTSSKII